MDRSTTLTWSWLNILTKKRADALLQVYTSLDEALQDLSPDMLKGLSCRQDTSYTVMNRYEEFDPTAYERELEKRSIQFMSIDDSAYPESLRNLPDPPMFLYAQGDMNILSQPCIAFVGTREMSDYGQRVCEQFIPPCVRSGVITVSGLALGIDAEVARQTMDSGGKTVAVLGNGLATINPKSNARLGREIIDKGGLVVSEFPLDMQPDKYTFPSRNRLIAGLNMGTVILEAGEGSGALITAELALEYGRDIFAVPGQIFDSNYKGCHQIIGQGHAKLVINASEVLGDCGIVVAGETKVSTYNPQSILEQKVYDLLTSMPQSASDLMQDSDLDAGSLNATLTMMELQGGARNMGGGMWIKQ